MLVFLLKNITGCLNNNLQEKENSKDNHVKNSLPLKGVDQGLFVFVFPKE